MKTEDIKLQIIEAGRKAVKQLIKVAKGREEIKGKGEQLSVERERCLRTKGAKNVTRYGGARQYLKRPSFAK